MATATPEMEPGLIFSTSFYLIIATLVAVISYIYLRFKDDDNWEKYGVKQGNMGITDFRSGFTKLIEEHGDTVGMKRGTMMLVTRDLDLLKQIMVKDFNNFVDRATPLNSNSAIAKGLFFLEGHDWRRVRQIMSPSFSTGKLKLTENTVNETGKKLAAVLEDCAKNDKLLPIKHSAGQYTSEIIARTAFGLRTNCLGGDDDEFTHYAKTILKSRNKLMTKIVLVMIRFPHLHRFLVETLKISFLDGVNVDSDRYLNAVLRRNIAERQKYEMMGEKKPTDFLQSLVTAKMAGDRAVAEALAQADGGTEIVSEKRAKTLSQEELIGQSLLVIFAAFETTSTTLQMSLYLLAQHPDIQEKVISEIDEVVKSDTPTHEELSQLKYTEQVINETLRLYPPASLVTRKASETKTYGDITIPANTGIFVPVFLIHLDPKNFPDPEKFDPDRFNEENKAKRDPMAFMPFGYGPRLCIGMRLAYLEVKIAMVHIFRKVKLELNDKTVPRKGEDVKIRVTGGLFIVDNPIQLQIKLRETK